MRRFLVLLGVGALLLAGCGGSSLTDITALTLSPSEASVQPQGTTQFTVDENLLVDWTAPDGGSVQDGTFTAPVTPGDYRVIATSVLNPTLSRSATVHVADIQVSVTPYSISLAKGTTVNNAFTAIVAGNANRAVTWSIDDPNGGSIAASTPDGSGNARANFTAGTHAGIFTIRAKSAVDSSVLGVGQVYVLGANSLGLNPKSAGVSTAAPNNTVAFTAVLTSATGAVDTTTPLTWDIPVNPIGATLSGSGDRTKTFTAPTTFTGVANCQVRVRTPGGQAMTALIQVKS